MIGLGLAGAVVLGVMAVLKVGNLPWLYGLGAMQEKLIAITLVIMTALSVLVLHFIGA